MSKRRPNDRERLQSVRSGSLPRFGYSAALTDPDCQLIRDELPLLGFWQQPDLFLPGAAMNIPPLPEAAILQVVGILTHDGLDQEKKTTPERAE